MLGYNHYPLSSLSPKKKQFPKGITFTLNENVGSGVSEISLWTWLTSTLNRLLRTFSYLAIFNLRIAEPVRHSVAFTLLRKDYSTIPHPHPSKRLTILQFEDYLSSPSSLKPFPANISYRNVWNVSKRKVLKFQEKLGSAAILHRVSVTSGQPNSR